MSDAPLHTVERTPRQVGAERSPLLILLHGYGSDEADLLGLADYLDPRFHVVSVRAPLSLDMGGHAWFPIEFTIAGLAVDHAACKRALEQLGDLLTTVQRQSGHDASDTLLLGFSQGAAMALSLLLARPEDIGGVAFLSGLWSDKFMPPQPEAAGVQDKPVLQTHGTVDPLIPITQAHTSSKLLESLGVELTYREYGMGHQIDGDCLRDVAAWLSARIDA